MNDFEAILQRRLAVRRDGLVDVRSKLRHFALINYSLPKSRLEPFIPSDRFEIPEFIIDGQPMALMSAVPFVDIDFHFTRLFPFLKFSFGQTNYRVYVTERKTREPAVWFFGTTLGSVVVHAGKWMWGIPWHFAHYDFDCRYDEESRRYSRYRYSVRSAWAEAHIDLEDTGEPVVSVAGFESLEEARLILTHPVDGYYYLSDKRLGSYSVWHETIPVTVGRARNLYFGLYERLGLLSRDEMKKPHSVFICPETEFKVFLPPRVDRGPA